MKIPASCAIAVLVFISLSCDPFGPYPITGISLDHTQMQGFAGNVATYGGDYFGDDFNLTPTISPSNPSEPVHWASSDESVAKVDNPDVQGFVNVRAVGPGTCVISITSKYSSVSASCTVTVLPKIVWTEQNPSAAANWSTIAINSDGSLLSAARTDGYSAGAVYTSSDGGINWIQRTNAGLGVWGKIKGSSDLSVLTISNNYVEGSILVSTDHGVTWPSSSSGSADWISNAVSKDGSVVLGARFCDQGETDDSGGKLYKSTGPSWTTWTSLDNAGSHFWLDSAASTDGTVLGAVHMKRPSGANPGGVAVSMNGGSSWTDTAIGTNSDLRTIAMSADGGYIFVSGTEGTYRSHDFGATWQLVFPYWSDCLDCSDWNSPESVDTER